MSGGRSITGLVQLNTLGRTYTGTLRRSAHLLNTTPQTHDIRWPRIFTVGALICGRATITTVVSFQQVAINSRELFPYIAGSVALESMRNGEFGSGYKKVKDP